MSRDPTPDVDVSLERIGIVLENVVTALESIVKAVDSKKAIVPLFIFIPSAEMRADQLERLAKAVRYEFEINGLIDPLPEEPS